MQKFGSAISEFEEKENFTSASAPQDMTTDATPSEEEAIIEVYPDSIEISDPKEIKEKRPNPKADTVRMYALYDKYKSQTGNKKHSALKAGFAETTAHNAKRNIEDTATYKKYKATLRKELSELMPAQKIAKIIASKSTTAGKQVSTKQGIYFLKDDAIAHKYLASAIDIINDTDGKQQNKASGFNFTFNTLVNELSAQ